MATYYHVGPKDLNGDLLSLAKQEGYNQAIEVFCHRWPEAGLELAGWHVQFVHLHATREEAQELLEMLDNTNYSIYIVNVDDLSVEWDDLEYHHPMIRDRIPAEFVNIQ